MLDDRAQFFQALCLPSTAIGAAQICDGVRNGFWMEGMLTGLPAGYFCVKAFAGTELTDDLKKSTSRL